MKDRTFGRYVKESRDKNAPILARTSGDVTAKHYLQFFVDFAPGCDAVYVALPKLTREIIFQLRDLMNMNYRSNGTLVKRVPRLYLFTRGDEASGNVMMVEFAESVMSGFGDRVSVIRLDDVSQSVVSLSHPRHPITILGTIPVVAAQKGQLHVVTIMADVVLTEWVTKALKGVGRRQLARSSQSATS